MVYLIVLSLANVNIYVSVKLNTTRNRFDLIKIKHIFLCIHSYYVCMVILHQ